MSFILFVLPSSATLLFASTSVPFQGLLFFLAAFLAVSYQIHSCLTNVFSAGDFTLGLVHARHEFPQTFILKHFKLHFYIFCDVWVEHKYRGQRTTFGHQFLLSAFGFCVVDSGCLIGSSLLCLLSHFAGSVLTSDSLNSYSVLSACFP